MGAQRFFCAALIAMLILAGCVPKERSSTLEDLPSADQDVLLPVSDPDAPSSILPPSLHDERDLSAAKGETDPVAFPSKPSAYKTGVLGSPGPKMRKADLGRDKESGVLSFDDVSIAEVAHEIFGDYLQVNYILDPGVKGKVNLYFEGQFTKDELLNIVTRAFREAKTDVVYKDGIYYIRPLKDNRHLQLADPRILREGADDKTMIVIYRPRFIKAAQAQKMISNFITPGRKVFTDTASNSLIFVESVSNARSALELIKAMDINLLDEIGMEIVSLKALTPSKAVQSMQSVMSKLGIFKGTNFTDNLVLVPLEHYNGVLIFAQDQSILDIAKEWLTAMDIKGMEAGQQINVYPVENGLSKDIAGILNEVFGKGKKKDKDLKKHIIKASEPMVGPEGAIASELTGQIMIIADEVNNSIVVKSNGHDWTIIKQVIEQLDIMPRAVLIEVVIAEVQLTDALEYGVEWFLRKTDIKIDGDLYTGGGGFTPNESYEPFGDLTSTTTTESTDSTSGTDSSTGDSTSSVTDTVTTVAATGALGPFAQGFSMFLKGNKIDALLTLLGQNTNVNILSAPTLLAMDNTEASIQVGGQEPTVTQSSRGTSETSTIVNSIQYKDTGIILKVTPHINSGGLVRLEVDQEIRTVSTTPTAADLNTPSFNERNVKTSLVAEDGKTVVIGGIIETSKRKGKTKVPVLGDVPVLGFFFSKTTDRVEKRELLIAITPYVVKRKNDASQRELLERLEGLRRKVQAE